MTLSQQAADAAALAASRERFRAALAAGMTLSQIAIASRGFCYTEEGEACERALLRERLERRFDRHFKRFVDNMLSARPAP